jgi:serine/threonine protein kinase/beta-lactam-binding protein with PASTA domain
VTLTSIGDPPRGLRRSDATPGTRSTDELVGRLLDGRYQILQRLARGGMATVYQAVDNRLTRTVAVKVMHVGLGDDAEFARKFDREARAAARLSHPNVVSVFDQGQDVLDGQVSRPYIVMEYVDGETLRDVINRESPMTPLRALEVMEPVLSALATAHEAGLVHRDVKPENVLISERGQIKVADFGLAKAISAQTSTATQGMLIGTVSYLPPELVVSGKADARSDVYSAGVVLFELLTGQKPHSGETPIQVAYAHVHRDVPPPSTFPTAGDIPPYLDALIARATARDADVRPHDARVLLTQVRRVRAALRAGRTDDPELTQDLRPVVTAPDPVDRADFEPTELVGDLGPKAGAGPDYSPPTVLDAPPPTAPQPATGRAGVSPERLRAHRERRARRRRRGLVALLLVLLLTAVAALSGWYLTEGRFTSAPPLTNVSQAEAETLARAAGLQVRFSEDYSSSVKKGLVVAADPDAGTKILKGGQIEAVVSRGPERVGVPTVVGLSQESAAAALGAARLGVGEVTKGYSETAAKGIVLRASKAAGTLLKVESEVDLVVSAGPKPIAVKDFRGKDGAKAIAALKKLGFTVEAKTEYSAEVDRGDVIAQQPHSGTGRKGDPITVTSSLGPPMVTVPNVSRMGVRAAQDVMKEAGFKTKVKPVAVNYIGIGYVVYTGPRARSSAQKGSTITLYVV